MSTDEIAGCCHVVDEFFNTWAQEYERRIGEQPLFAAAEALVDQVLAVGYAAELLSADGSRDITSYLMTGSDFDPLLDNLNLFASSQSPALALVSDDAILLSSGAQPFMSALVPLAETGQLDRTRLVITGGPISRWKALGAVHPIGADGEYYSIIKDTLAHRQIMIP